MLSLNCLTLAFCKVGSQTTVNQRTIILGQTSNSPIRLQTPSALHVYKRAEEISPYYYS